MTIKFLWEEFLIQFGLKKLKWPDWDKDVSFDIKDRDIKFKSPPKSPPEREFMREFKRVRQPEPEDVGRRRLFINNYFSLYVWYVWYRKSIIKEVEKTVGFELIYGKSKSTSIRYEEDTHYKSHNELIVDERLHRALTGIYGARRGRVSESLLKRFHEDSAYIPDRVRRYVENVLRTMM